MQELRIYFQGMWALGNKSFILHLDMEASKVFLFLFF